MACNVSLIIQRNSSPRVMCAAFNQTYFGKVTQNPWWDPPESPRKQLLLTAPSEPSRQSECVYLGAHLNSQASRWD